MIVDRNELNRIKSEYRAFQKSYLLVSCGILREHLKVVNDINKFILKDQFDSFRASQFNK